MAIFVNEKTYDEYKEYIDESNENKEGYMIELVFEKDILKESSFHADIKMTNNPKVNTIEILVRDKESASYEGKDADHFASVKILKAPKSKIDVDKGVPVLIPANHDQSPKFGDQVKSTQIKNIDTKVYNAVCDFIQKHRLDLIRYWENPKDPETQKEIEKRLKRHCRNKIYD